MSASLVVMLIVLGAVAGALICLLVFWGVQLRKREARVTRDNESTDLTWGIVDTFATIDIPTV